MSPFKLSDHLIDATNLYISIMQPENKRRDNMVEMRTCRWEWHDENECTVLQCYVIMDFVKMCNFRRCARYVSLGVTVVGSAPLKLGTWIAVVKIVMNIAVKVLLLYYRLQISNYKQGSGTKLHGFVYKFNADL